MNRLLAAISTLLFIINFIAADFPGILATATVLVGTDVLTVHANGATYTIDLNSETNEEISPTHTAAPACTFQPFTLTAKLGDRLVTKTITDAEETVVFDADLPTKKSKNVIMRLGTHVITVPPSSHTVTIHPEGFDAVVRLIFMVSRL